MLTPYFTSDQSGLMARYPIDVWAFGHTHGNVDFRDASGCRVVSNQMGYPNEYEHGDSGFREGLIIAL